MGEKKTYTVKAGDRMSRIAHANGYKSYQALYQAQSEELRDSRPNPEILKPGDVVELPDKVEEKLSAKDKKKHTYEEDTELPRLKLHLVIGGKPLKDKDVLVYLDGKPPGQSKVTPGKVKTDGKGVLDFHVTHDTTSVVITCADPVFMIQVFVGYLLPIGETAGVEQRLDNLGYRVPIVPVPAPAGSEAEKKAKEAHERTISKAVKRFQEDQKKKVDGKVTNEFRKLLMKTHEP